MIYGPDDKPIFRRSRVVEMLNEATEDLAKKLRSDALREMQRQNQIMRVLKFRSVNGLPIIVRGGS